MVETEGLAFRSWRGAALGQRIWGGGVGWGALTDRAAHRGYGPRFPCQSPFSSSRSLGRQGGGGSMGHPRSVLTGAFLPRPPGGLAPVTTSPTALTGPQAQEPWLWTSDFSPMRRGQRAMTCPRSRG